MSEQSLLRMFTTVTTPCIQSHYGKKYGLFESQKYLTYRVFSPPVPPSPRPPLQACKMSFQSSCVGASWRQHSAMWHVTQRVTFSAATMTAGAAALPVSRNATAPSPTLRSWRRTWKRAKRPGTTSTKSSWNQVGCTKRYRTLWGIVIIVVVIMEKFKFFSFRSSAAPVFF